MDRDRRQFERMRFRASCEFRVEGGRRHTGLVADVSARGLYILSSIVPEANQRIEVTVRSEGLADAAVIGRVSRVRKSHRSAKIVIESGFSVQVDSAPEDFFRLLMELGTGES